jgi:hypothetical protein
MHFFLIPLIFFLSSCVSDREYNVVDPDLLAKEVVEELIHLYPPDRIEFNIEKIDELTPFGRSFVKNLRKQGYILATNRGQAFPLRYILDQTNGTSFYRLTVFVGSESLTRAYFERTNVPASYWIHQE